MRKEPSIRRECATCGGTFAVRPGEDRRPNRPRPRFCSRRCYHFSQGAMPSRFWSKADTSGDCWLWTAARNPQGYGRFQLNGRQERANRVAWALVNGPIPAGMHVMHRCDNPPCVNPAHLLIGPPAENMHDKRRKGRQARGEGHGWRTHPDAMPRGDRNGSRRHPEKRPRGENHGNAKLTEALVREIRRLRADTGATHRALATRFGISASLVGNVLHGVAWKHIG